MEMLHSNTHHAVGDSAAVRRRGATDGDPASTSYDESLRSALSELLQSSSVKLEADHADLLVDALLSPRNELQAERADKRPPKPATKFDAEIKYLYGPDEKGESDDSADTTLTEADMADAGGDYAEGNEDLPLGGGGHDTAYGNQRAIPQRIPSRPIARGRDDLQIGGGNGDVCRLRADNSPSSFMTRSLRARLGNDLSEHLNSKWLSRCCITSRDNNIKQEKYRLWPTHELGAVSIADILLSEHCAFPGSPPPHPTPPPTRTP